MFRASRSLLVRATAPARAMVRSDVSEANNKIWKGYHVCNGEVTRHLSPHEQQAVLPWMRTWHSRILTRVKETWINYLLPVVGVMGYYNFVADTAHDMEVAHRD